VTCLHAPQAAPCGTRALPAGGAPRRPPRGCGDSRARVAGPAGPVVCSRLESQARRFRAARRAPCIGPQRGRPRLAWTH